MTLFKKLPVVVTADDYHDFDFIQSTLNSHFMNRNIKYIELGYALYAIYLAVFYVGKKPTKNAMVKLLAKTEFFATESAVRYFLKNGCIED
jgi:hypothetical protein